MGDESARRLARCVDRMGEDDFSLDECLRGLPDVDPETRELIALAGELRMMDVDPSVEFVRTLRRRLDQEIFSSSQSGVTFIERLRISMANPFRPFLLKGGAAMSRLVVPVLLLSLFGGGAIVVNAADEAVPGGVLYALDTALEGLRFSLTRDEGDRVELNMGRAEERLEEVERMVASGYKEAHVEAAVAGYVAQLREAVQSMERYELHAADPSVSGLGEEFQAQLRAQERLLFQLQTRAQAREIGELFADARAQVQAQNRLHGREGGTPLDQSGDSPGHPSGNERATQGPWSEMPPAEAGPQEEWQVALSRVQLRHQEMLNLMAEGDRLGLEERLRLHLQEVEALRVQARERAGGDPQVGAQMSAELDQALAGGMTVMNDLLPNAPEWARELLQRALRWCQTERLELQAMIHSADGTWNEEAGQGREAQPIEVPPGQNGGQPGQYGGEGGAGSGSGGPHSDGNQGSGGGH